MTSPSDLKALLERVDAASGADREIDFAIARWLGWTEHTDEADPVFVGEVSTWWAEPGTAEWDTTSTPPYFTHSLEAVVALADRAGPKGIDAAQLLHGALEDMANGGWRDDLPLAPQIALYLLAALLRALIAGGEG